MGSKYCGCCKETPSTLKIFDSQITNENSISMEYFFNLVPKEILNKMIKEKFPNYKQNNAEIRTEKVNEDINDDENNTKEIIYHGEFNNMGQKDGQGKLIIIKKDDEKIFIHGIWKNDNLSSGTIYYGNGSIYSGQIKNYLRDGKGKFMSENETYEGEWKEDQRNGQGILNFKDGTKYEGGFKNNQFNGRGKMEWKDGFYYKGQFNNNTFHGFGYLRGSNGHIYNGNFQNGLFHGEGEFKWVNGPIVEFYKGNYSFGKKDGKGEFHFNNGHVYNGEWKSGNPDGEGIYETKNRRYKGNWRAGIFMQLIDAEDKECAQEENLNLTFKTPNEDILGLDHITTSLNSAMSKSSLVNVSVEVLK